MRQVKKVDQTTSILRYSRARVSGSIVEVRKYKTLNDEMPIKRLDADFYMVKSSGEVLPYKKMKNRSDNLSEVRKSIDDVRSIINANFTASPSAIWFTCTYAENMTDHHQLTKDRQKFWQRLRYAYPDIPLEYVSIAEPQERGAWHLHELWKRTDGKSLFIPFEDLVKLWGHGSIEVKRLENSDNIGAYISAYLQNIPEEEALENESKAFRKGARLHLYPPKMKFYRCSKGIQKPSWQPIDEKVKAVTKSCTPCYRSIIEIHDDTGLVQSIQYEQYNTKIAPKQHLTSANIVPKGDRPRNPQNG